MNEQYFSLTQKPFSLIPDPEFIHFSKKHKTAYSLLLYGLHEQTGIILFTGEIGIGKTTSVRHLLNEIDREQITIGLINNTRESPGDLTNWISLAFNIDPRKKANATLYKDIQDFLIQQYSDGRRVALIVDEALNLCIPTLEELQIFTNINSGKDLLIQIVLVGRPELVELLQAPELTRIAQRFSVESRLTTMNIEATSDYVNHRLAIAGSNQDDIFSYDAIAANFYHAGVVPHLINTLCGQALVHDNALDCTNVDLPIVMEVAKGRNIRGINRSRRVKKETQAARRHILNTTGVDIALRDRGRTRKPNAEECPG